MNCGINNHELRDCNNPIKSYGIILFKFNKLKKIYEYLFICRKDSLGYVEFLRGKYSIKDEEQIQRLIDEMTIQEKQNILNYEFNKLWKDLWNNNDKKYINEKKESQKMFYNIKYNGLLEKCIHNSKTKWNEQEWGFPKGRRNYKELDIQCAMREFTEETSINVKNISIIENLMPFQEIFIGSNYKSYMHVYFLAKYNNNNYVNYNLVNDISVNDIYVNDISVNDNLVNDNLVNDISVNNNSIETNSIETNNIENELKKIKENNTKIKNENEIVNIKNRFNNLDYDNIQNNFKKTYEVSKIKWMTLEEAKKKIRYYNYERIQLLCKIDNILNTYNLLY